MRFGMRLRSARLKSPTKTTHGADEFAAPNALRSPRPASREALRRECQIVSPPPPTHRVAPARWPGETWYRFGRSVCHVRLAARIEPVQPRLAIRKTRNKESQRH